MESLKQKKRNLYGKKRFTDILTIVTILIKMKKLFLTFVCLIMASAAFAQESERFYPVRENVINSSSDGRFVFDCVSHAGFGFAHVSSQDFTPWKWNSFEFFTNLVGARYKLLSWSEVQVGLDLSFLFIRSGKDAFYLDDEDYIHARRFQEWDVDYDSSSSTLLTMNLNVPVLLKGNIGSTTLGAGVNLSLTPSGNTRYSIQKANTITNVTMTDAKVVPLSYSLMATLSYKGLGLYFRYYPSEYPIIPNHAGSPKFRLMTLGAAIGF